MDGYRLVIVQIEIVILKGGEEVEEVIKIKEFEVIILVKVLREVECMIGMVSLGFFVVLRFDESQMIFELGE